MTSLPHMYVLWSLMLQLASFPLNSDPTSHTRVRSGIWVEQNRACRGQLISCSKFKTRVPYLPPVSRYPVTYVSPARWQDSCSPLSKLLIFGILVDVIYFIKEASMPANCYEKPFQAFISSISILNDRIRSTMVSTPKPWLAVLDWKMYPMLEGRQHSERLVAVGMEASPRLAGLYFRKQILGP